MIDGMRVKLESVNITFETESYEKCQAQNFIFKLYFFNSIFYATNEQFEQKTYKEIKTKFNGFYLIHKMLNSRFACAELYYKPMGEEEMKHIILFGNQRLDLYMILKKDSKGKKLSILNAIEINKIETKLKSSELNVCREFYDSLLEVSKRAKQTTYRRALGLPVPTAGKKLFKSPSFASAPEIDLIKQNAHSTNLYIKSVLLYIIPDEREKTNGNGAAENEPELEEMRVRVNSIVKNKENFNFLIKILVDNFTIGSLASKNASIFAPKTDKSVRVFREKMISFTAEDIFIFYNTSTWESKQSTCLFSTLKKTPENSEKDTSKQEIQTIGITQPVYFWKKSHKNFLSLKIYTQTGQEKTTPTKTIMDIAMNQMAILFDLSKWIEVLSIFLKIFSEKFSEQSARQIAETSGQILQKVGFGFKGGQKMLPKISSFFDDVLLRVSLDHLVAEIANKDNKLTTITLKGILFSNQKNLFETAFCRGYICPRLPSPFQNIKPLELANFFSREIHISLADVDVAGNTFRFEDFKVLHFGERSGKIWVLLDSKSFCLNVRSSLDISEKFQKIKSGLKEGEKKMKGVCSVLLSFGIFKTLSELFKKKVKLEKFDLNNIVEFFKQIKHDEEIAKKGREIFEIGKKWFPHKSQPSDGICTKIPPNIFINNDFFEVKIDKMFAEFLSIRSKNNFAMALTDLLRAELRYSAKDLSTLFGEKRLNRDRLIVSLQKNFEENMSFELTFSKMAQNDSFEDHLAAVRERRSALDHLTMAQLKEEEPRSDFLLELPRSKLALEKLVEQQRDSLEEQQLIVDSYRAQLEHALNELTDKHC